MPPRVNIIERFSSHRHRVSEHISETLQQIALSKDGHGKSTPENQRRNRRRNGQSKKFGLSETAEIKEEEKKPALGFPCYPLQRIKKRY